MGGRHLAWILVKAIARVICLACFRVRVFGQRHVPEREGVLIVSNHQSFLDPALVIVGLERTTSFMARESLFGYFGLGTLIRLLNAFPVKIEEGGIGAVREAVNRLKAGHCVIVFAEGTRSWDGTMGALRPGVTLIARRAGVPVVPVVVEGASEAWPRGGFARPHSVSVAYGRPISAEACRAMTRDALVKRLRGDMLQLQARLRARAARARGAAAPPAKPVSSPTE